MLSNHQCISAVKQINMKTSKRLNMVVKTVCGSCNEATERRADPNAKLYSKTWSGQAGVERLQRI